ncbi:MAG: hypothetical protein ABI330_10455 [Caldimonas sp.]|nr:hypothetical protein [Pseudomonadota bacterium]
MGHAGGGALNRDQAEVRTGAGQRRGNAEGNESATSENGGQGSAQSAGDLENDGDANPPVVP